MPRRKDKVEKLSTARQSAPMPDFPRLEPDYVPPRYGGCAPMFQEHPQQSGADISTNAHPEIEYEHLRRMPTQREGRWESDRPGQPERYVSEVRQPPMSERVRDQVFSSLGERIGTMSSASQLDRSRGCGQTGADGGLLNRASRKGY